MSAAKKPQQYRTKEAAEQARRDRARLARSRKAAEAEAKARAAEVPATEYHKCATCDRRIRVESKRWRGCAGIRVRPNVDAIERRLPGSFESNSR
jgi:hypothetical protein